MSLATFGSHPWIASLYYAVDEDLNIYFLSSPQTLHCKQIEKNNAVAIAIADSPQKTSDKKKGIQLHGEAKLLTEDKDVQKAVDLWRSALEVTNPEYSLEGMKANKIKGRMYVIMPKKIKFFNQELWDDGAEPILEM